MTIEPDTLETPEPIFESPVFQAFTDVAISWHINRNYEDYQECGRIYGLVKDEALRYYVRAYQTADKAEQYLTDPSPQDKLSTYQYLLTYEERVGTLPYLMTLSHVYRANPQDRQVTETLKATYLGIGKAAFEREEARPAMPDVFLFQSDLFNQYADVVVQGIDGEYEYGLEHVREKLGLFRRIVEEAREYVMEHLTEDDIRVRKLNPDLSDAISYEYRFERSTYNHRHEQEAPEFPVRLNEYYVDMGIAAIKAAEHNIEDNQYIKG